MEEKEGKKEKEEVKGQEDTKKNRRMSQSRRKPSRLSRRVPEAQRKKQSKRSFPLIMKGSGSSDITPQRAAPRPSREKRTQLITIIILLYDSILFYSILRGHS